MVSSHIAEDKRYLPLLCGLVSILITFLSLILIGCFAIVIALFMGIFTIFVSIVYALEFGYDIYFYLGFFIGGAIILVCIFFYFIGINLEYQPDIILALTGC